jgi:integrase/recombinase XerD
MMTMTIDEAIEEYRFFLSNNMKRSVNTVAAYVSDLTQFSKYLEDNGLPQDIELIETSSINSFIDSLRKSKSKESAEKADDSGEKNEKGTEKEESGKKESSINRMKVSVRGLFQYLNNYFDCPNPAEHIELDDYDPDAPFIISREQIRQIISDTSTEKEQFISCALATAYGTGMRVSEVCSIELSKVNLDERKASVIGKEDNERDIYFPEETAKMISDYLPLRRKWNTHHLKNLFILPNGHAMNRQYLFRALKKRLQVNGINSDRISPHTLRHSFATHLLDSGVSIRVIQEILGHGNITTTQIYTEVSLEKLIRVYNQCMPRE